LIFTPESNQNGDSNTDAVTIIRGEVAATVQRARSQRRRRKSLSQQANDLQHASHPVAPQRQAIVAAVVQTVHDNS